MLILNFSHPLTVEQISSIETITGQKVDDVVDIPVQFTNDQPFEPQLNALLNSIPITAIELQKEMVLVNPPSLNFITALLLAELHGRTGHFPSILRLQPMNISAGTRFEVAEILNLQHVREKARQSRYE